MRRPAAAVVAIAWLALFVPAGAQVVTVNMSRDLVRLGIATRKLTPDEPTLDARPLFQATFNYVRANHTPRVTVDKGAYYVLTSSACERETAREPDQPLQNFASSSDHRPPARRY